jgi:hypothetical protein
MNKLLLYIKMLTDAGLTLEEAEGRAIKVGLMCCGAYCSEAGCCIKTQHDEKSKDD